MAGRLGETLRGLINARGREPSHVAEGVALCVLAVLLSAAVAAKAGARPQPAPTGRPQPTNALSLAWPPLLAALTFSALRVWNAPASTARSRALGFWGAIQGLNALWFLTGTGRRRVRMATAAASLGAGIGYASAARKVDAGAAALVSPYIGWGGLTGFLRPELWRKGPPRPSIH
jgi:tryptophan-rich sensory protein